MDGGFPARTDFERAFEWLSGLRPRGIKLGLTRIEAALDALGNPQERFKSVIIAGTNGKGSTAAFLSSIIHQGGARVGLYTSPHLMCVTERMRVGGTAIQPLELVQWTERIRGLVEGEGGRAPIPLTFFEALTVMALGYFAEREVDVAILEVGLGGRLDATNAVRPVVSVLTPVGLDHQRYLGETLEAIAHEKAGIIKSGATVVTGVQPELFRKVVGPRALSLRCPIRRAGVDFLHQWLDAGFRYRGWIHKVGPVPLGLRGMHQGDNAALACAVAESLQPHGFGLKPVHMAEGLQRARHPGRLERRPPLEDQTGERWPAMLLDGAHNPHAATALSRHVASFLPERPRIVLFGAQPDKDVEGILSHIVPHVDGIVATSTAEVPMVPESALHEVARRHEVPVTQVPDLPEALSRARQLAGPDGGLLVTGSLYLLGEVMPLLPDEPSRPA